MKAYREEKKEFKPINVIIESEEELRVLSTLLYESSDVIEGLHDLTIKARMWFALNIIKEVKPSEEAKGKRWKDLSDCLYWCNLDDEGLVESTK